MNILFTRYISLLMLIIIPVLAQANNTEWLKVQDTDLRIVPGSALDFSGSINGGLFENSAIGINNEGQLAYDKGLGDRARFLCAPLVFTKPYGGFPNHADADELAQQIKLHGYNLARLHHIDTTIMEGSANDFEFNPVQMDRFYYLLAAFKKQGIYWMIDAATSWNGAFGNIKPHRFAKVHNLNLTVHYDVDSQKHWKRLVDLILNVKNKYTQINILQDPNLALVTLFNEGGINFSARKGYPNELEALFINWQKSQGLKSISKNLPDRWEKSSDAALMQRFISDLELDTSQWMTDYLRKLSYKGLVTAYNNGKNAQVHASRKNMDVISVHAYHDHPNNFVGKGSSQKSKSSISEILSYVSYFSTSRYFGKPFIVDEYDHPYWSPYRKEAGIALSSYAAMQDWDAICRFSNPVALGYNKKAPRRLKAIYPFGVGLDPVARAGETLAYFLFRRGDVVSANKSVALEMNDSFLYSDKSSVKGISSVHKSLSLLARVGLKLPGSDFESDLTLSPEIDNESAISKLLAGNNYLFPKELLSKLRESKILNTSDIPSADAGIYSTTNQIILSPNNNQMTVITPRTEAVVSNFKKSVKLSNLTVVHSNKSAVVSVSALDDQEIASSRRMLLIVATDAKNSGDVFSKDRKKLIKHGSFPVLIESIKIKFELKNKTNAKFKLYALSLSGQRKELVPVVNANKNLLFNIDMSSLSSGPTTYFELIGGND